MRRGAAGLAASLGLALALLCSPAYGAAKKPPRPSIPREIPARVAGAITVAWHGDPARGCAAAGLCDVSGSLVYAPQEAMVEGVKLRHGGLQPTEVDLFGDQGATVRVERSPSGGEPSTCVDTVDASDLLLTPTPVGHDRLRFDVSDEFLSESALASGRCAGPVNNDLRGKLPSGVLNLPALQRGSALLNMSSRHPFDAGPFSGEVVSTLGVRVGAKSPVDEGGFTISSGGSLSSADRSGKRVLQLTMEYELTGSTGTLVTRFAGLQPPLCVPLDACGASGAVTYTPGKVSGTLWIFAGERLHAGQHPTLRSALHQLRAGRLRVRAFADLGPESFAHASATVTRVGDATCTDSVASAFAPIYVFQWKRRLQVRLAGPTDGSPDGLRTRCPGPSQNDAVAGGSLAAGRIASSRVGARKVAVVLSRPGAFSGGGYVGTRSGSLTLRLVRKRIEERVVRGQLDG
ncbi:MAG TPA: hypothetical protein VJU60_13840 [Thermoleophilaceae bacterium]|nr:hypothetical protein [Thermoleophilaceae bacterium]